MATAALCVLSILSVSVIPVTVGAAAPAPSEDGLLWRVPENDGVNCLYLQLRFLGYTESYESFRRLTPDGRRYQTMSALSVAAARLGYDLVPVRLTRHELEKLRAPVIAHLEGRGPASGQFGLVLGCYGNEVALVEGGAVLRRVVPRDEFLRSWTRYALVERPRAWPVVARRLSVLSVLLYAVALTAWVRHVAGRGVSFGYALR
jgi:ABC-type bacteriocin/lantibiotic exporter with double-glycine peptidase domain